MSLRLAACLAIGLVPQTGAAVELLLPAGARALAERISPADSYELPMGPFDGESVPAKGFEGRIVRLTWRVDAPGLTTLQLLAPLRAQIEAEGFTVVFQCKDDACGGFDFRFHTEVVPAPDMYVDIRNYRFVSATRGEDEALSLLVSRSRSAAFVQMIVVNREVESPPEPAVTATPDETAPEAVPELAEMLLARGHAVLDDLVFETGSDALDPGSYDSLRQLSAFMEAHPTMVIALVGHTDSIGPLDQNISLSKRRAESVRARLTGTWGVAPARVQAEGMGYLAPVASNLTAEGREANRRVEVILLSQ